MTRQISVTLPVNLIAMLKSRTNLTHRSLGAEIHYLIEVALANKSEMTREFWQLLHHVGGDKLGADDQTA